MSRNVRIQISSTLLTLRQRIRQIIGPHALTAGIIAGASIIGAILALVAQSIEPDDRIVVGNTAGTLTTMIELSDHRILIGAGPSRSHSADLIGRTTRPWERGVDLLVIPAWDTHHLAGTLGLLERHSVESIAVVGLPGDDPAWTMLERAASDRDVSIRYVDRPAHLELDDDSRLLLSEIHSMDGMWVRASSHGLQFDVVDSRDTVDASPDPRGASPVDDHVLIATRSSAIPAEGRPSVAIVPQPHWQHEVGAIKSNFAAGLDRNEHLVIALNGTEARIDQRYLEPGAGESDH